ncbi:MAG: leucine-rich repeat protein [Bacteroidaceae bacterium]|nr:leucine-rich repeat protein [Bacteroidaceae bacterium]
MKRSANYLSMLVCSAIMLLISCNNDEFVVGSEIQANRKINIEGEISQVYQTRVNDAGFCDGDEVGIYVVDYEGDTPGALQNNGNRGDNVKHSFDEANYKWKGAYDLYFKDDHTNVDIYGYYPFATPDNVSAYAFEVKKDQSTPASYGKMGGYEASDFLWGKTENVSPTDKVIKLKFRHMMASARVTLVQGEGFTAEEWAAMEKAVLLLNTKREATIDLSTGVVTPTGDIPSTGTIPYVNGEDYRAIIVPQTVAAGTPLISITVGGTPYVLKKEEDFTYVASKQHNFTIAVKKREGSGYEFVLTSESITAWENDAVSHDATAREYVVIDVAEAGTLKECIEAAGKEIGKVRNLKVAGQINAKDFSVMRNEMVRLSALNLKEVEIVAVDEHKADIIPDGAMEGRENLVSLVLPDKLKSIGSSAFGNCTNLSGSLIIPEGVEGIGSAAFIECTSLSGILKLPSTLKYIGSVDGYIGYWDGTFKGCNFVCELVLPEGLEYIGMGAFYDCKNLYGELRLPDGLKGIGSMAFYGCENFVGDLIIPQGVIDIPDDCFNGTWLGGALVLHDGVTTIGARAFANTGLKGELRLPRDLEVISHEVFYNCDFSGELVLPKNLYTIGDRAFAYNWRLMGVLEIPENIISIGAGAFAKCRSLEGVIFPKGLESIRYNTDRNEDGGAFQDCFGIGRIVCKGTIPAYVQDGAFHGVPKDNFTLEVPESAIAQYQAATGWKEFKRISAYRNLVVRPMVANAINTSVSRDLVLNADDEWVVESQPDWVTLDKTSGTGKHELKLTFAEMAQGSATREGEVVFKLVDKDYRTRCKVTQYNYEYAEDAVLTLQSASKGNGVNLVFLGDGYNAKDVSEGKLLTNVNEAVEHFFNIQPYKAYRDYFNVYTAISVSPESGVGGVNTIIHNRFNTTAKGGVTLGGRNADGSDYERIFEYACKAPTVGNDNLDETLIIMIPNSEDYGGICYMYDDGAAIAYCPLSDYGYPMDFRGVIQHEAGGHGFGKLGDEYIYHNAFIDNCPCTCCPHVWEFNLAKAKGWYENLSLTGMMNDVPWSHLIFHKKYDQIVDIFEGGYMHTRGVFRSEQNSCMNNMIPYYSTISRETIVKRIKAIAGEEYSFEDFVANDVVEAGTADSDNTRSSIPTMIARPAVHRNAPVLMGKRPNINAN